jgi:hypothetical protein
MLHYGQALMAIAATDGKVSPRKLQWLVSHQRKFGAPDEIITQYHAFNPHGADLNALLGVPDDVVLTLHALVEMETATAQMRKALFHTHTL